MLAAGWDQCAYNEVLSPAAAAAERAAGSWAKQLLGLPASASVGFVTGAQAANTVGLAVGRHRVLADAGWDVERDGLCGAPRVAIVASEERHATIDRAARLLGLGTAAIRARRGDGAGRDRRRRPRPRAGQPSRGSRVIVCLQAGNVNTGACDDLRRAIPLARTARRVGARRRRLRPLGRCEPAHRPPRRRGRGRRLVGDRRAQVAQRPLRQRPGLLRRRRAACRDDVVCRVVPHRVRRRLRLRAGRSHARVIKEGKGIRCLGRAARARHGGCRRARRPVLCPDPSAWPPGCRRVERRCTTTSCSTSSS